jgi:dTDP-4-dehydrorhamnose 3,5-epimerase
MTMRFVKTELDGVLIVEFDRHSDARGSLVESWHKEKYANLGIRKDFVQDNLTSSSKGVLRGLHFQNPNPQAKLISVAKGEIFDVAVDIRIGSPTFGKWFGATLSDENCRQMYVAEGFAHGFVVLSDSAIVLYKCTGFYRKESEKTIRWDDPSLGINWPVKNPILSDKDKQGLLLSEIPPRDLFRFDVLPQE